MTNTPAWPGEPGFPPNPSFYGSYWLKRHGYVVAYWIPEPSHWGHGWEIWNEVLKPKDVVVDGWTFGGQLLDPAEVAKLEREAELRGWEQAISFLDDKFGDNGWILDCMRAEFARRSEDIGA